MAQHIKHGLRLSTLAAAIALAGCGEDFKDCNGFFDKTFGRDGCAVVKDSKSISVTPAILKANTVLIDQGLQTKLSITYLTEQSNSDVLLVLDNKANMQPVGVITSTAILKYYSDQKLKEHSYESPKRTQKIMVHGKILMKKRGNNKMGKRNI